MTNMSSFWWMSTNQVPLEPPGKMDNIQKIMCAKTSGAGRFQGPGREQQGELPPLRGPARTYWQG